MCRAIPGICDSEEKRPWDAASVLQPQHLWGSSSCQWRGQTGKLVAFRRAYFDTGECRAARCGWQGIWMCFLCGRFPARASCWEVAVSTVLNTLFFRKFLNFLAQCGYLGGGKWFSRLFPLFCCGNFCILLMQGGWWDCERVGGSASVLWLACHWSSY